MRRSWTGLLTLTITGALSFSISCSHKPAYSEIESKDSQRKSASEQPVADSSGQPATAPAGESQAANPEQPVSPPPPPPPQQAPPANPVRMPAFIDQITGELKDLPNFPKANRTNAQIGPVNGADAAMFVFETTEPFPSIRTFYDNAIKKHGWTIVSQIRDPEHLRWELIRGATSEALIEVKGDPDSSRKGIILSRAERPKAK